MQNQVTRICFIVNPASNRHGSVKYIEWIREEAAKRWAHFEITIVKKEDSLVNLAKEKSKDFDVVVACGGDGTVSQVINGLAQSKVALGILPIGSGNDFVKSVGLDRSLEDCMEILSNNTITEIDLIRYEGDAEGWCANTIGLGVDGWANYYAHQTKWLRGRINYFFGGLKAIFTFRGCDVKIQTKKYSNTGKYVMVTACNGKWEGGSFFVAPKAKMNNGSLDLLTIRKVPLILLVGYLLHFRWGPKRWMKGVKTHRAKSVELCSSNPVAVHRDGEHLGNHIRRLKLTVEKKVLKVIVPESYCI